MVIAPTPPPLEVDVLFDAWFDTEDHVWIAESQTPRYGIATDAASREELAEKLEVLVADVAEELHGHIPATIRIAIRWTVGGDQPAQMVHS